MPPPPAHTARGLAPILIAAALGVALALPPPASAAEGSAAPGALAREVLGDEGYQKALVEPLGTDLRSLPEGAGGALGALGRVLAWAGILLALVLAAVWIGGRLRDRRGAGETGAPAEDASLGAPDRALSLAEAERLAAAGAFGEAIHVLLLVAVERLAAVREAAPPVSLTSRELVRVLAPEPGARGPFLVLVGAVEVSLFGGRALDAADFQRCRAALDALHAPEGGR